MSEEKYSELAKGIGIATEKALEFIEKIIAGPVMEGTGIFTDKVKYWRFKNQVNIIIKARDFLEKKGIETPKKVPLKDVTTLLEYASFEENETIIDCWAKLLANAMNPENEFSPTHIFSQILNQLSINEIYILVHMFKNSFLMSSRDRPYFESGELLRNSQAISGINLIIDNLIRLRLIEEQPPLIVEKEKRSFLHINDDEIIENRIIPSEKYRLSSFGVALVEKIIE